ncbi:hypothetical protein Z375_01924, partial [Streptococcus pyogenes ABC020048395]
YIITKKNLNMVSFAIIAQSLDKSTFYNLTLSSQLH